MIERKHLGAMNKQKIISIFKEYGFILINYIFINNGIQFTVEKDYSKNFNINFNGLIALKVTFDLRLFQNFNINFNELVMLEEVFDLRLFQKFCNEHYPKFTETTNLIPKSSENHIYPDGSICYAPP